MEHLFNVELAKQYGVNAAIVIRHLQFWVIKNKSNEKHLHDGRTWTYCSIQAFTKIFPYWTTRQLRTVLDGLIDSGIILKGQYSPKGYDQTTWYAFQDEKTFVNSDKWICQFRQMDRSKLTNGLVRSDKPIPNPRTILSTDNKTNGLKASHAHAEMVLELDQRIAEGAKLLAENLEAIFRPTGRERTTFARIIRHLIERCQANTLEITIFTEAASWAQQANESTARNKKGLFVQKVKDETGFTAQTKLLKAI